MQVLTSRSCSAVCSKQARYGDRFVLTVIPQPKRGPFTLPSSRCRRPQSCCSSWLQSAPIGSLAARPSRISCRAIELATVNAVAAAATLYTVPFFFMMLFAPAWEQTKKIVQSELIYVPVASAYLFLLLHSWQPDTLSLILPGSLKAGLAGGFKPQFLPALDGISTLFSRLTTAASLWVHLVAINLFAGCKTYIEGRNRQLPTRHTTFLCMLFGPLGVLSSILTEAIAWLQRRPDQPQKEQGDALAA